jgi:ribose transport system permease protein
LKLRLSKLGPLVNLGGLLLAWLAIFLFFSWKDPQFMSAVNIETIARQTLIVALAALGMTFVIINGAIDLSVGSGVALVGVAVAWCLRAHYSPEVALVGGLLVGAAAGLVNGLLVTKLRVGPFIATLGTLLIFRGAAKGLSHEQSIYPPDSWLPILSVLPPNLKWMIFPPGVWILIVLALISGFVLNSTRFGRHTVAVGSNENAARLCGVPVDRVRLGVFVEMGFFIGVCGVIQFSRLTIGDPTVADGLELEVIAAVVIGGASLVGGQGTILGSLAGAFIMSTIEAGATQLGWDKWVQQIVTGAIIVIAVAVDKWRLSRAVRS